MWQWVARGNIQQISCICPSSSCCSLCFFLSSPRSFDWLEDKKGSKKTRLPAKQFIDTSLAQIQRQIRDEQTFPTKFGRCIVNSLIPRPSRTQDERSGQ